MSKNRDKKKQEKARRKTEKQPLTIEKVKELAVAFSKEELLAERIKQGGACFALALFVAARFDDNGIQARVIHAIALNGLVHAVAEIEGKFVVDLTQTDTEFSIVQRVEVLKLMKEIRRYDVVRAMQLSMRRNFSGPWHSPYVEQLNQNHEDAEQEQRARLVLDS